jgi:hypothetical protein
MTAILLPADRGPAVKDGRQRLAFVAPRHASPTAPLPPLGEDLQLDIAAKRDRPRSRARASVCLLRCSVVITADALVRVIGLSYRIAPGEALSRLLANAENGAAGDLAKARLQLARAAGFRTWKALYEYNAHRDRRGRPDADGRVTREVIGWAA